MANQLIELLQQWHPHRDDTDWVLGTIYKTEGSCYRKAGAMMLFNGLGQQFGLLSGGCLESDIQLHARRAIQHGQAITLCYDASDEDDLSFQLGIGCGGIVHILLQPVSRQNSYLGLDVMLESLQMRRSGYFHQLIPQKGGSVKAHFVRRSHSDPSNSSQPESAQLISIPADKSSSQWLITPVTPAPHLMVIGGGLDALPVVDIAAEMGWETTLWDSRPANARREFFMRANTILESPAEGLSGYARKHSVDAVMLMTHNIKMDALALQQFQKVTLRYLALLGPDTRREKVLRAAKLKKIDLKNTLSGPAGLKIGGELPESIALSVLSECHAYLMNKQVDSFLAESVA